MSKLFDRKEAAKYLRISVETLDRHRKSGKLRFLKIGDRILLRESDLIAFSETCLVPVTAKPIGGTT